MTVRVKKSDPPETTEVLAEAIVRVGEALAKLKESGLNEKAIIVLVHDHTRIAKRDIKTVLNSLATLRGYYCRRPK